MELARMNPWWSLKKVPIELLGKKRFVLDDLISYVPKRMALLLHGVRRVGKSTLLFQIIQYLLDQKINPYQVLYFTFDEYLVNIEELLLQYEKEIAKEPLRTKQLYVFLDEIQKHPAWWDKLKVFYDLYPNIKWFLSGSNGLILTKQVTESLAGRVFSFQIQPLSFSEYLSFLEIQWDSEHIEAQMSALTPYLSHYLETSGFPELYQEKDSRIIRQYFLETIENRIIFQDIPLQFKIEEPLLLQQLFKVISGNPGMTVMYSHLGDDFKRDARTIESYLGYLEKSYLLRKLAVFSSNLLTSQKKLKKYYPTYSAFSWMQKQNPIEDTSFIGHMVEGEVAQVTQAAFFIKPTQQEEVDLMVRVGNTFTPVEVKYRNNIPDREIQKYLRMLTKMNFTKGYIITRNERKRIKNDTVSLQLIPLVEFLLQESTLFMND